MSIKCGLLDKRFLNVNYLMRKMNSRGIYKNVSLNANNIQRLMRLFWFVFLCLIVTKVNAASYSVSSTAYSWESTSTTLVAANFSQTCTNYPVDDDEATINFTGGFTFPMGGVNYSSARVFSNGQIQLGADNGAFRTYSKTAIPEGNSSTYSGCVGGTATNNLLSVAWLDLNPSTGGTISWQQKGTGVNAYVVVSWTGVYIYGSTNFLTVQAILYANGKIKYQYQSISGTTWSSASPSIGVQLSAADYTAWTTTLSNGTAILFSPPGPTSITAVASPLAASTCGSAQMTVTMNGASGVYAGYTGTVSLGTSSGHGTWSLASGSGTFIGGGADSGSASYTYSAADAGVAKFTLIDPHAESLTGSASDNTLAITGTSANITFSDNVFVVAPTDSLGSQLIAGRAHSFTASFYKKDSVSGICSVASGYTGVKALDFWYAPTSNQPAGAVAPKISSSASSGTCSTSYNLPSSAPAVNANSNLISLSFTSGVANFYVCPSDVGQYAIGVRDDTLGYSSNVISGLSTNVTARPFGLFIDQITYGSIVNPGGTSNLGSGFAPAQAIFSARVSAKNWVNGQDTQVAGTPDPGVNLSGNPTTTGFAASTLISASNQTPASGILGSLSGGNISSNTFSSGVASASLSYSEVGSMNLSGSSSNYLSSGYNVPGVTTGNVGRFYASSFILSAGSSVGNACAGGAYSYMGQNFPVVATLNAVGVSGGTLNNYDTSKGYGYLLTPTWRAVDSQSGVDLSNRLSLSGAAWNAGVWSFASNGVFSRLANPDGQYDNLQLGLSGSDTDGATIASQDMSYSVAGTCSGASCNAKMIGAPVKMRFGRLEVQSAYVALLNKIQLPIYAKYWAKSANGILGWSNNTLDSCTQIPYADMSIGSYSSGFSGVNLPSGNLTLSSGKGIIVATRTGNATVAGSAVLGVNLSTVAQSPGGLCASTLPSVPGASLPWLQSNFCGTSSQTANPAARLTWGSSQSKSNSIVIMRELF